MMSLSSNLIPFPPDCDRATYCIQTARLAALEAREQSAQSQLDRMESKIDKLQYWILGVMVSTAGASVALIAGLVLRKW